MGIEKSPLVSVDNKLIDSLKAGEKWPTCEDRCRSQKLVCYIATGDETACNIAYYGCLAGCQANSVIPVFSEDEVLTDMRSFSAVYQSGNTSKITEQFNLLVKKYGTEANMESQFKTYTGSCERTCNSVYMSCQITCSYYNDTPECYNTCKMAWWGCLAGCSVSANEKQAGYIQASYVIPPSIVTGKQIGRAHV